MADNTVATRSVVTTGSRASAAVAAGLGVGLVAVLVWSVLVWSMWGLNRQPAADIAEPPTPTVRWETPPKFGGRGGDYSVAPAGPRFRPGPYR